MSLWIAAFRSRCALPKGQSEILIFALQVTDSSRSVLIPQSVSSVVIAKNFFEGKRHSFSFFYGITFKFTSYPQYNMVWAALIKSISNFPQGWCGSGFFSSLRTSQLCQFSNSLPSPTSYTTFNQIFSAGTTSLQHNHKWTKQSAAFLSGWWLSSHTSWVEWGVPPLSSTPTPPHLYIRITVSVYSSHLAF